MNNQPIEGRVRRSDGKLDVVDIWRTIQGEGPFAGSPSVFVRLAGCNLQCSWCDTDYTSNRKMYTPDELLEAVLALSVVSKTYPLVVITGGEPLRQSLSEFIQALWFGGFKKIQIETNGTLAPAIPWEHVSIVCSPKGPTINRGLQPHILALKYVLQAGWVDSKDGLPVITLGMLGKEVGRPDPTICDAEIYVQPLDESDPIRNKLNLDACLDSVFRFGHKLCLQTHKMIGLK